MHMYIKRLLVKITHSRVIVAKLCQRRERETRTTFFTQICQGYTPANGHSAYAPRSLQSRHLLFCASPHSANLLAYPTLCSAALTSSPSCSLRRPHRPCSASSGSWVPR